MQTPRRDERGATAVEYGLIVALIAAVIIATVAALGVPTNGLFSRPCAELAAAGRPC